MINLPPKEWESVLKGATNMKYTVCGQYEIRWHLAKHDGYDWIEGITIVGAFSLKNAEDISPWSIRWQYPHAFEYVPEKEFVIDKVTEIIPPSMQEGL
jgi:hypothetical protein